MKPPTEDELDDMLTSLESISESLASVAMDADATHDKILLLKRQLFPKLPTENPHG